MIEPYLATEMLDHSLIDHALEEEIITGKIVISSDKINLPTVDSLPIGLRLLQWTKGKITEDPEDIVFSDLLVDCLDESGIVTLNGFVRDLASAASCFPLAKQLVPGEPGPLAVFDDIAVPQMEIGGEPEFGHDFFSTQNREIQSEKSMFPKRAIENGTRRHDPVASSPAMDFDDGPMPPSAQPAEPGYSFANGALHLVKDSIEMRITGSPVPRSMMRRGRGSCWQPFIPEFRLVHPYRPEKAREEKSKTPGDQLLFSFFEETHGKAPVRALTPAQMRKRALDHFRFSLPKPYARILEPFRTHQWPLLMFLTHDAGACELATSNPALAFILAQKLGSDKELISSLGCSALRQRDLMEVLGLPSLNSAVNLFRKIDPASISGDNWRSIVSVLEKELSESKSRLNHLPSINYGVVEILAHPEASRVASAYLLNEVANDRSENYRGRVVHMITSTLRMQEEMRNGARCNEFASLARLRTVHDEVAESYRRRVRQLIEANELAGHHFFSPPIPGIPGRIEPITSAAGLVDEGEEQGNCVAGYAYRVNAGHTFIYRVLHPERATLSIVRKTPFGSWEIGELEKRFNTDTSVETEEFVQAWLDRHRKLV